MYSQISLTVTMVFSALLSLSTCSMYCITLTSVEVDDIPYGFNMQVCMSPMCIVCGADIL